MKAILIEDDMIAVRAFGAYMHQVGNLELVGVFSDGMEALSFLVNNRIDLVVSGIEIHTIDGVLLGKILRAVFPEVHLIYIADDETYAMDALNLNADAYLLKSSTKFEFCETLKKLPDHGRGRAGKQIFVKTFGYFDVFVDNQPIMFRSSKAKELMALLVDRQGGTVNTEQIICALWEDRPNDEATQNLCWKTTRALKRELSEYGIEDIFVVNRSLKRIDTECITCDLYELLEEKEDAKRQFVGEYMLDYSWAEGRMANLSKFLK